MCNTGIICSSTERTPTVLPEMAELLPPLLCRICLLTEHHQANRKTSRDSD